MTAQETKVGCFGCFSKPASKYESHGHVEPKAAAATPPSGAAHAGEHQNGADPHEHPPVHDFKKNSIGNVGFVDVEKAMELARKSATLNRTSVNKVTAQAQLARVSGNPGLHKTSLTKVSATPSNGSKGDKGDHPHKEGKLINLVRHSVENIGFVDVNKAIDLARNSKTAPGAKPGLGRTSAGAVALAKTSAAVSLAKSSGGPKEAPTAEEEVKKIQAEVDGHK